MLFYNLADDIETILGIEMVKVDLVMKENF